MVQRSVVQELSYSHVTSKSALSGHLQSSQFLIRILEKIFVSQTLYDSPGHSQVLQRLSCLAPPSVQVLD